MLVYWCKQVILIEELAGDGEIWSIDRRILLQVQNCKGQVIAVEFGSISCAQSFPCSCCCNPFLSMQYTTYARNLSCACTSISFLPQQSQVNLRLPPHKKHLHVRITDKLSPILPLLRPTLLLAEFPVVLEEQVDKEDLDFMRCKEPSRTNMHTMSKAKVFWAGRHELVVASLSAFLALIVEAVAVEFLGIRVHGFVLHHMAGDHYAGSLGDDGSV